MKNLIDRQDLIESFKDKVCWTSCGQAPHETCDAPCGEMQCIMDAPTVDVETISDGYHTFADLYEQRMILSAALAKNNPYAWKSKLHEDGSLPFGGGWFIMGFDTADGEYTYHYELKDWDLFECKEIPCGKPWDGHTSKDVRRLLSLPTVEKRGEWLKRKGYEEWDLCSWCFCYTEHPHSPSTGKPHHLNYNYCPNCGADTRGESE